MLTADDKSLLEKPEIIDLMRQKFETEEERIKILRGTAGWCLRLSLP